MSFRNTNGPGNYRASSKHGRNQYYAYDYNDGQNQVDKGKIQEVRQAINDEITEMRKSVNLEIKQMRKSINDHLDELENGY